MPTRLILEDGRALTVKDDSALPVYKRLSDITEPDKRSGSFSKTFKLNGSKENILILGGIFDVNMVQSSFNINAKTIVHVEQDGVIVFPNCYLQLKKTTLLGINHTLSEPDDLEFEAVVFNEVSEFFRIIGNSELSDLKIGSPDNFHELNKDNVLNSMNNDYTDGYTYAMYYRTTNVYKVHDFMPLIFGRTYFDAIFNQNGYVYEWATIDDPDTQFSKVVHPFVGKFEANAQIALNETVNIGTDPNPDPNESPVTEGLATFEFNEVARLSGQWLYNSSGAQFFNPEPNYGSQAPYIQVLSNVNRDFQSQYNNTTGVFTANLTGTYDIDITCSFVVTLEAVANCELSGFDDTLHYNFCPFVDSNADGTLYSPSGQSIQVSFNSGDTLTAGQHTYSGTYIGRITVNANAGDEISMIGFNLRMVAEGNYTVGWETAPLTYGDVIPTLDIDSITVNIVPRITYQEGITIDLNAFIPKKVKQSEYLKAILLHYNLMMVQDEEQDNKFHLISRDTFYDTGNEWNFSRKLARDESFEIEYLPNVTSKAIELSYKDDKDAHNVAYLGATQKTYGQLRYVLENENVKGVNRIESMFSPTPVGRTPFGAFAPFIPFIDPDINMRMLFHVGEQTAEWYIEEADGTITQQSTYNCVHHFNDPFYPDFDLNFGVCDYYFYQGVRVTYNNIFNLHYRRTFKQINDGKRGIGMFNLSHVEKAGIQLNDRIFINNSWWNVEEVQHNANANALTRLLLLSIDDEVSINPVGGGIGTGTLPNQPIEPLPGTDVSTGDTGVVIPTIHLEAANEERDNTYSGGNSGTVHGTGNVIQGLPGVHIFGHRNRVNVPGAFVIGNDIVADKAGLHATDIFFRGKSMSDIAPEKSAILKLSQSSTSNPSETILSNDYGEHSVTRVDAGLYAISFVNDIDVDKSRIVFSSSNGSADLTRMYFDSSTDIVIQTFALSLVEGHAVLALADGLLDQVITIETFR